MAVKLSAERLAFGYPGKPVGRDVDLALEPGEVICLLGANGSGKTTLFKTLLGLLPPQGGRVHLDGRCLQRWSRRALARVMGYIPQAHAGTFPFSVIDMVLMGRAPRIGTFSSPSQADVHIAEQALESLGIAELRDDAYTEISGGQRQLVLIARALAQEPEVLIMDEPTANLDFGNQVLVLSRVRALVGGGRSVMLSSHDPDHAFMCADRVGMLHGGVLERLGAPEEVVTPAALKRLYRVDVEVLELGADRIPGRVCVPSVRNVSPTAADPREGP